MSLEMSWYLENSIRYHRFSETVDNAEFLRGVTTYAECVKAAPVFQRVHIIVDLREVDHFDVTLNNMRTVAETMRDLPVGWTVVITSQNPVVDKVFQLMATIVAQLFNYRLRMFRSMEQAMAFLSDADDRVAMQLSESVVEARVEAL